MSNSSTRCIGSHCVREDLLWKYNQTALPRYQFDKNFQMRRKILIQFSAQVVWARKQSCEAASLKKTISRTFAAAVGVEQESFVNWKAWRESLFQTVPLSSASVFLRKCCRWKPMPSVYSTRSSINLWFSGSSVGVGGVVLTDECIFRLWILWYFWMIIKITFV